MRTNTENDVLIERINNVKKETLLIGKENTSATLTNTSENSFTRKEENAQYTTIWKGQRYYNLR